MHRLFFFFYQKTDRIAVKQWQKTMAPQQENGMNGAQRVHDR